MIPKIIHQVWEGRTEYLGDVYKALGNTWKNFHPDWDYEFWDENRIDKFIYDYYPEMIDVFYGYPYDIQRWHTIRYLILYKLGGLYVDFDYECLESVNSFISDDDKCYFVMEPKQHVHLSNSNIFLNNTLMISPKEHSFLKAIIRNIQSKSILNIGDKYLDASNTTGVLMLTDLYEKYAEKKSIGILPSEQFAPLSREDIQSYIHGSADEKLLEGKIQKAAAIHYFNNTWLINKRNKFFQVSIPYLYQIFLEHPVICVDKTNILPGALFFAIRGSYYNGNEFAKKALEMGCSYAVVDDPTVVAGEHYLLVDDVLKTLERLADYHHQILKTPVIGITGTCGKTTTKDLIVKILSTKYKLVSTRNSENSSLGASLTLLSLKPEHEIAIIEMGACHPGMIREISRIVRPQYGIITNIGLAHLNGFGSFDNILRTKLELYDYLRQFGGTIFIHTENEYLMAKSKGIKKIFYGKTETDFVSGKVINSDPYLYFKWSNAKAEHVVLTNIIGKYNLLNALAAIAVGLYFDIPAITINKAIEDFIPINNRSQWKKTLRNNLIIDTYNANPYSMHAALDNFFTTSMTPKAVILGDMLGLGDKSTELHMNIIKKLDKYKFDKVILCGEQFSIVNSNYFCFSNVDMLILHLSVNIIQGYTILIKGSNKMNMNKVIDFL